MKEGIIFHFKLKQEKESLGRIVPRPEMQFVRTFKLQSIPSGLHFRTHTVSFQNNRRNVFIINSERIGSTESTPKMSKWNSMGVKHFSTRKDSTILPRF